MDELAREIKATIAAYQAQAIPGFDKSGQRNATLVTIEERKPSRFIDGLFSEEKPMMHEMSFPLASFDQPAHAFEKEHGVHGIAATYNLPEGIKAEDMQSYVCVLDHARIRGDLSAAQCTGRLDQLASGLAGRNPELQELRYDPRDGENVRDIVMGVASGFKSCDIQLWLDRKRDPATFWKAHAQAAAFGRETADLRWVPASQTLEAIQKQSAPKTNPAPAAGLRHRQP